MTDDGGIAGRRAVLLGLGGLGVTAAGVAAWSFDLFAPFKGPAPVDLEAGPIEILLESPTAGPRAKPSAIAASLPEPPTPRPQPPAQQAASAQRPARIPGAPTPRPEPAVPPQVAAATRPAPAEQSPPQSAVTQPRRAMLGRAPTPRPEPVQPAIPPAPPVAARQVPVEEPPVPPRVAEALPPAPTPRPVVVQPAAPPPQVAAARPAPVEPQPAAVVRPNVAPVATRRLALYNTHTLESFDAVYWQNGRYDPRALQRLNWFLRDHYANKAAQIDPEVFDLLYVVQAKLETPEPFRIISGYRSLVTNARLRAESSNVALHSYHTKGMAVDVALADRRPTAIAQCATGLRCGGVGTYRSSGFVHLDVGPVRYWYA